MKRLLACLAFMLPVFMPLHVSAQSIVAPCVTGTGVPATSSSCSRVTTTNPLPVTGPGSGGTPVPTVPGQLTALVGTQQIVLSGSAQTLTVPTGAKIADLVPEGSGGTNNNCLRYRDDGTNPTASVGMPLQPGQDLIGYTGPLATIAFINATGATCTINVAYYK